MPHAEDTFCGCVDLNLYFLTEEPKHTSRRKFCVKLHNLKHKTWYLATETKEARTEWFQAMKQYTLFGKKLSNKDLVPAQGNAAGPNSDLITFEDEPTPASAAAVRNPFMDGSKTIDLSAFTSERFDWADPVNGQVRNKESALASSNITLHRTHQIHNFAKPRIL